MMGQPIRTLHGSVHLPVSERLLELPNFQPGEEQQQSFDFTVGVGQAATCAHVNIDYG